MSTTRTGHVVGISFGRPDPVASEDNTWIYDGHTYVTVRLDDDDATVSGGHTTITWDQPAAERMGTECQGVENADIDRISAEPSDAEVRAAARALDPEAWETDLSEERGADRHMIRGRRAAAVTLARAALVAARKVARHE